jgi:phytoene dehydrogenase-like protein
MSRLGLELPLLRRDPHYFLPTTGRRHLLLGSNPEAASRQFRDFFSLEDWEAHRAMGEELRRLRDDLAPAWLEPPLPLEETAERFVRAELRTVFLDLCRGSVAEYLDRFGFRSDLVRAMYAVTDGVPGLDGDHESPGSGLNFLVHNMCRLPGAGGTWMMVAGGMGTVTQRLAALGREAGVEVRVGAAVGRILVRQGAAEGVALASGEELRAGAVLVNADPFSALALLDGSVPAQYVAGVERLRRDGSTLKVNLCLRDLPRFTCLPDDPRAFGPTIHLLADEDVVLAELGRARRQARAGQLPELPAIEWYVHTTVDPSLRDLEGRHSSALFVQWVPYQPAGSSWEREEGRYVQHLLSICDRFAPGTSVLVEEAVTLTPPGIERRFGIARGHIHHVDNGFGFAERLPYETPVAGLFMCGAGCHPAGSVIGAAGHNAARAALKALGR